MMTGRKWEEKFQTWQRIEGKGALEVTVYRKERKEAPKCDM